MNKTCTKCSLDKSLDLFPKMKASKDGRNCWCRQCSAEQKRQHYRLNRDKVKAQVKAYQTANPDNHRNNQLKRDFGITIEQYREMLEAQNNSCAICKRSEDLFTRSLAVDHCHLTGRVRGLLCITCNRLLGNAYDNKDVLLSAIDYLNK
jgi:hypothetical protein